MTMTVDTVRNVIYVRERGGKMKRKLACSPCNDTKTQARMYRNQEE